jgi:hypothetical protein
MNYIIDFERVNELTTTKEDKPDEGYAGVYQYGVCRKIIKEYLMIYNGEMKPKGIEFESVIDTLVYNRILINKAILREDRINKILNDV